MSASQPVTPQPGVGKTVIAYATFEEAFQKDPGQVHDAVEAATAKVAGGDPVAQQQLIAEWNTAVGALTKSAKPALTLGSDGDSIMHTPQNEVGGKTANHAREAGLRPEGQVWHAATRADCANAPRRQLHARGVVREVRQRRHCRLVRHGARPDYSSRPRPRGSHLHQCRKRFQKMRSRCVRRLGHRPLRRAGDRTIHRWSASLRRRSPCRRHILLRCG